MNRHYGDILSRIPEPPTFFQKEGVPRWGDFSPKDSTDVYAHEAALVEIACQLCDTRFKVLFERRKHDEGRTIAEMIDDRVLAYRDPPDMDCCPGGPSMTSETVVVLEYWVRDGGETKTQWRRDPSLEVSFRRPGDPWTEDMRAKAQTMIDDPDFPEDQRHAMIEALESDAARHVAQDPVADGGDPPGSDPVTQQ